MAGPTREFWEQRFRGQDTPWERGEVSPQLTAWLEDGSLAPCRILVPGCGSGMDVAALARAGFEVTALDYAPAALELTERRLRAESLQAELILADVLHWETSTPFPALYEQTCLCALHPDHWQAYAAQLAAWIEPGGHLFGLFMQALRPGAGEGRVEGPPYHCDINAVRALLPERAWRWPAPPYPCIPQTMGRNELAIVLMRINGGTK
jgi:SAM-dependent methyltransferase